MRFTEHVQWAEGLFLQPHHMQQMQTSLIVHARKMRQLAMPFDYGFADLDLDEEAFKARRIVIKRFSAVMPDGLELSMPGNCNVEPLELEADAERGSEIMIYLMVPMHSDVEPNLVDKRGPKGRYLLRETRVNDENTADNEIPLMKRNYNAFLSTDEDKAPNCVRMPLCKVSWVVINASLPSLAPVKEYMPPFIRVTGDCALLAHGTELLFQLKGCRNALTADFDKQGFDLKSAGTPELMKILQLQLLNKYIRRLDGMLVPDRIVPFQLYQELGSLLAELEAGNPQRPASSDLPYDHDDLLPVIDSLIMRIRAILLQGGLSTALAFPFGPGPKDGLLKLSISDERILSADELYLALEFSGNMRSRIEDIENGDNFRLIDERSVSDRIRGLKLTEVRYPPQYLPNLTNTLWVKVQREQSSRMWQYISEERNMMIDFAVEIFPALKVTLYACEQNRTA